MYIEKAAIQSKWHDFSQRAVWELSSCQMALSWLLSHVLTVVEHSDKWTEGCSSVDRGQRSANWVLYNKIPSSKQFFRNRAGTALANPHVYSSATQDNFSREECLLKWFRVAK